MPDHLLSRRRFLRAASAAGTLSLCPRLTPANNAAPGPNILFLLTDDHRWNALGCMGNRIIQTPNIDALADAGACFVNTFVTTSICCASRASIFTGQYARRHGVHGFNTPFIADQLSQTYPDLLRAAGYRVGFIGKYGVGDNSPPPAQRFDYWKGFTGQGRYFPKTDGRPVHITDIMADQAVGFLDTCAPSQPFCLSISFKAPHCQDGDPRQFLYAPRHETLYADQTIPLPPTANDESFQKQPDFIRNSEARNRWKIRFSSPALYQEMVKSYYRLITGVDEAVGTIIAALHQRGLADNTVIILLGDNGFFLGEHGLAGKWFMHEESIRVPLVIHDPRLPVVLRGSRPSEIALNIDIAPTILSLAGLAIPQRMQGSDLTPLLRGQTPAWRTDFFYEHLFKHPDIAKTEGVRTRRHSYWQYLDVPHDAEWLFDLQNDPHQTRNLAADPASAEILGDLRRRLQQYRQTLQ